MTNLSRTARPKPLQSVPGMRAAFAAVMVVVVTLAVGPAPAQAQSAAAPAQADEIGFRQIVGTVPRLVSMALSEGSSGFFRLIEDVQLLDMNSEIDRLVGNPHDLNDSTAYKLSLLPFHIRYPTYRELVDQMTRLDTVRSRRIYNVTPDSVHLIELRIQPVETLDEMTGLGVGHEVQQSLFSHFTTRELADLAVFLLAQQPLFPRTDDGWQRLKLDVARGTVPLALAAMVAAAPFDSAALSYAGKIAGREETLRLGWYAGFRDLGMHWHPNLRGGVTARAGGFELAAGVADQVRPTPTQRDRELEVALREGWLNQLVHPLGWDVFFEAALRRSIQEAPGFTGDSAAGRAGIFFKRDRLPLFPNLVLRGSTEADTNLRTRVHLAAALGVEHSPSGIAAMVQGSHLPVAEGSAVHDDRVTAFLAGTMEPISAQFVQDMHGLARQVEIEWEGLLATEAHREAWERRVVAGAASRTPEEAQRDLRELGRLVTDREDRLAHLATALGDYLESRRRAYRVLGWTTATDDLHGPLQATVLVAARDRVFGRLTVLARDVEDARTRLAPLRSDMTLVEQAIAALEARDPTNPALPDRRRTLAGLQRDWDRETEAVRRSLDACDHFQVQVNRILAASSDGPMRLRAPEVLGPVRRRQIARLTLFARQ
jgi:hypothetical protein